jgi:hypothetical protein
MTALPTIQQLRFLLRIRHLRLELARHDKSIRKESFSVALPTLPSRDDRLPVDPMPEDPTPDEIQRACQRIQATWSDQERRYRELVLRPTDLDQAQARNGPSHTRRKARLTDRRAVRG